MVLPASEALSLTNNAITNINDSDVQTEVGLAEAKIRAASGVGLFNISYNATIIGNPPVDPRTTADLTLTQQSFYNNFINAGYTVGIDIETGYWSIAWASTGAETAVVIYSFRTSFDPTAIITTTINAFVAYFQAQIPIVHATASYNGSIDETAFGGTSSVYYEFTIVANQDLETTNHSAALKTHLIQQGIGYTTGNCAVFQMVS